MKINLEDYDWICHCHAYGSDDIGAVVSELESLGCGGDFLRSAIGMMESEKKDIGFCYSNNSMRGSVIYIGRTDSTDQFLNTMFHEFCHLAVHIADCDGIDKSGEEFCYLAGNIGEKASKLILYHIAKTICFK